MKPERKIANLGRTSIKAMDNPILRFFRYEHLPLNLQERLKEFYQFAHHINKGLPESAEKSAGLRKLLEAKDCFMRAAL